MLMALFLCLGISSLAADPSAVGAYLTPLFDHARSIMPPSQLASTPVYVLATAGMRLLPLAQSSAILQQACKFVQNSTPFLAQDCENQIRIISGEEEGVYGWIAINYLMDGFDAHGVADKGKGQHSSTYGFLDMGGASTQIAFEPGTQARKEHADNLLSVNLRLLDGMDVHHPVFVTTWLGYGTNQARERYIDSAVARYLKEHPPDPSLTAGSNKPNIGSEKPVAVISDPCLPKSLLLTEARHPEYVLQGAGNFKKCLEHAAPLLNRELPCPDPPCLMGVHVPPIDFSVNHFIGISEYWYSTNDIWSLGGVYDFPTFEKSAIDYCSREWDSILSDHADGPSAHQISDVHRLEMQCFKAAWIVNVLHDGIGIPRLSVDKGGEGSAANVTEDALIKAGQKGFAEAPTHFQSVNEINNVAVSWTLGRMVLEVTDSIPRSTSSISHEYDEDSETPLFVWKSGHRDQSWIPNISSTLKHAISRLNPIGIVVFLLLAVVIYYFGCSGRRRASWIGTLNFSKPDRNEYGLVSMEEGNDKLQTDVNLPHSPPDAASPHKSTHTIGRTLMPFRILASRAASYLNRHPVTSPASTSFLVASRPNANKTQRMAPSLASPAPRPTAMLRHVNSSPALFRGQPPARTSFATSRSGSKLHIDLSSSITPFGLHADATPDAHPAPLTPPARSDSPWSLRMKPSPRGGAKSTRLHVQSHRANASSSDSDGYLSVPVGVSSISPDIGASTRDGGNPDLLYTNGVNGGINYAAEEKPGLRSRNSSYTNLGALARNRGGHSRQISTDVT